jgi:hypothetical protein
MAKALPLTQGRVALVDDADYPALSAWKWTYLPHRSGTGYAVRWTRRDGRRRTIYLHRQLTGAIPPWQVDHRDGDGLNNQRANLRVCAQSHNFANRARLPASKRSRFRGVSSSRRPGGRPWRASAKVGGVTVHLGSFATEEAAARAYDAFARRVWGEFARTNYPDEGEQ